MTELAQDEAQGFVSPVNNPSVAAAVEQLTSTGAKPAEPAPNPPDSLDGPVSLPAGFKRVSMGDTGTAFVPVRKAWVRELNGEDEERIAKTRMTGDVHDFIRALLEAGVEKLGDQAPSSDDFNSLTLGDRDYLLLMISRATYGDTLAFEKVTCPHCSSKFDISLDISEDIPVTRLDSVDDAVFDVRLRRGRIARASLPTLGATRALADAETAAEANTALIMNAVQEIRGGKDGPVPIAGDEQAARRLSVVDRQTLVDELYRRMPGPQYNEVKFPHSPGCGEEVHLQVTLVDLFRGM